MSPLKPLEFRDCVVDGPAFRNALQNHEKDLKLCGKRVKAVCITAERVFKAMESLQQAMFEFSASLLDCSANMETASHPTNSSRPSGDTVSGCSDLAETDDDVVIKNAFGEYAKLIDSVEEARSTMLVPIKETVLTELIELRTVWLSGPNTDAKAFLKDTTAFCQKLDKYLALKPKEQSVEAEEQMIQDRQKYIARAFKHVTNIHEAEEWKKSKFIQTISLFMKMLGTFYHQAFEHFQDSSTQMAAIDRAAQRSRENFEQICDETKTLKEKLMKTPWEQVQTGDYPGFREGYLYVLVKKTVASIWIKHFCIYSRDLKMLQICPYTQSRAGDLTFEHYSVKSCVRRSSDSIDRRYCFDVELDNRSGPLTLQAQSQADLQEWLQIMDGKEPFYGDRHMIGQDPDLTQLNEQSYQFLCTLLGLIEEHGLQVLGIYRISGLKSKVNALVKEASSPQGLSKSSLSVKDIHSMTGAVKHFIRHLQEPLMTFELHDQFLAAVKRSPAERLDELARLLALLPKQNKRVLDLLISHLSKVASYSRQNEMTASNLGIVFAPSLLRSREESVAAIMNTRFSSVAIESMIEHWTQLNPNTCTGTRRSNSVTPIEPVYVTPVSIIPIHDPSGSAVVRSSSSAIDRFRSTRFGLPVDIPFSDPPKPLSMQSTRPVSQSQTSPCAAPIRRNQSAINSTDQLTITQRNHNTQSPISSQFMRNLEIPRRRRPAPLPTDSAFPQPESGMPSRSLSMHMGYQDSDSTDLLKTIDDAVQGNDSSTLSTETNTCPVTMHSTVRSCPKL